MSRSAGELREAERAVEAARREAARVGAELAAANQFLRHHAGAPHGAAALADELDVDSGYELAVAAALDGRLRAAVVDDRAAAASLLDRAGADGGRALVVGDTSDTGDTGETGGTAAPGAADGAAPAPGAARLLDHVRARGRALALARALLRDTWLVEDLEHVAADFRGVAVTAVGTRLVGAHARAAPGPGGGRGPRAGRAQPARSARLRVSERAAQAELDARAGVERATAAMSEADSARDRLTNAHRAAVRALDELREEQRRIGALIERRRAAPDDGPDAGRRSQLAAELAAERRMLERAERERAERARRTRACPRRAGPRPRARARGGQGDRGARGGRPAQSPQRLTGFDEALAADREAGEHVAGGAAHLRAAGGRAARRASAARTRRSPRPRSASSAPGTRPRTPRPSWGGSPSGWSWPPSPPRRRCSDEERQTLDARLERVARRREQLGPVNPLAQEEYAEAVAHVEELETQRADLETALRELEKLIADTDKQIRTTFEQTFTATASAFEELAAQLFPGGKGRLRLVSERDWPRPRDRRPGRPG